MLTDARKTMLRAIAKEPREARSFTHGGMFLGSPLAVDRLLVWLQRHGYIIKNGELYEATNMGKAAIAPDPECRWTKEVYKPSPWNIRAGGDDHLQYKSRGV